jgi:hypothetical protein
MYRNFLMVTLFEIHGYLCDTCGRMKSLVVLRSLPLAP